jgi:signal transduction histidine kinase
MEERVKLIGGRLGIDSAPGAGARVHAEFSLPEGGFD